MAYVYAATSPVLRSWSQELGLNAVHIGVAVDPLARIASMRGSRHAAHTCFATPYEPDPCDGDWTLVPMDVTSVADLPEGCLPWAGTIRVSLPEGATLETFHQRLALMLRPLEALHCAQLPPALERRATECKFLPVLPRYTVRDGRAALVRDLYRLEEEVDVAYVADALGAALRMLGTGRRIFDRFVDAYWAAPSHQADGFASDPDLSGARHAP